MGDLREKLEEYGCSSEFIADALRFEKLYTGDLDEFMDTVEDILMRDDEYEEEETLEEEADPIYISDYNYDGNDENIYFEEEDETFEDDEEDEE